MQDRGDADFSREAVLVHLSLMHATQPVTLHLPSSPASCQLFSRIAGDFTTRQSHEAVNSAIPVSFLLGHVRGVTAATIDVPSARWARSTS